MYFCTLKCSGVKFLIYTYTKFKHLYLHSHTNTALSPSNCVDCEARVLAPLFFFLLQGVLRLTPKIEVLSSREDIKWNLHGVQTGLAFSKSSLATVVVKPLRSKFASHYMLAISCKVIHGLSIRVPLLGMSGSKTK